MAGLYVGLISGTSMDGIDAALVRLDGPHFELIDALCVPYAPPLAEHLRGVVASGPGLTLESLAQLDVALGEAFAQAALTLLERSGRRAEDIDAIGSHGQTVRHRPGLDPPFTLQLADANVIAARTGIATVADFRRRDVALGGQGAPLTPVFHAAVLSDPREFRVVANIGGIANLTLLRPEGRLTGFDTGPGNALMDAWIRARRGEPYDRDGAWAASGHVVEALLQAMLGDPYFDRPPPKSTGVEHFNLRWLETHSPLASTLAPADVAATLCELSARTMTRSLRAHAAGCQRMLVCGGGAHNRTLMQRLAALLPDVVVQSSAEAGLHPDWVEASAFAWLAAQTLAGRPGNDPAVTGARQSSVLGAIHPV
jgi:anhydro-N-acetylmuramic acid kinase